MTELDIFKKESRASSSNDLFEENLIPIDFLGIILSLFIIGSMTLFGKGQLLVLGILLVGTYIICFLIRKQSLPIEIYIFIFWLFITSASSYLVNINRINVNLFLREFSLIFQIVIMSSALAGITLYRGKIQHNFLAILIGSLILVFANIITGDFQEAIDPSKHIRIKGNTNNPNYYAFLLLIGSVVILYFWNKVSNKLIKAILLLLIFGVSIFIIFSGSRKSFLGFLVLILLWCWFCYRTNLIKKPYHVLTIILIVTILTIVTNFMIYNTLMGERFKRDLIERRDNIEDQKRIILYEEGFELIKKYPLFGVGFGNFRDLSSLKMEAHSEYIEIAANTGILGFLIYFSIFFILYRRLNRIQRLVNVKSVHLEVGLFKASLLTMLIVGFLRPHYSSIFSWVYLSSIIGYTTSIERKQSLKL